MHPSREGFSPPIEGLEISIIGGKQGGYRRRRFSTKKSEEEVGPVTRRQWAGQEQVVAVCHFLTECPRFRPKLSRED